MLLIILFTTALAEDTFMPLDENENSPCNDTLSQTCKFQGSETFPETEEEVNDFCRALIDHSNCWSRVLDVCDLDDKVLPLREVYKSGVLLDLCNEKYPLYNILVSKAKCIADSRRQSHGFCLNHVAALEEKPSFRKKLEKLHSGYEGESRKQLGECVSNVFQLGCLGITLKSNCGESVQKLLLWIVDKGGILKIKCKEEFEPTIDKYATLMKLDM